MKNILHLIARSLAAIVSGSSTERCKATSSSIPVVQSWSLFLVSNLTTSYIIAYFYWYV